MSVHPKHTTSVVGGCQGVAMRLLRTQLRYYSTPLNVNGKVLLILYPSCYV